MTAAVTVDQTEKDHVASEKKINIRVTLDKSLGEMGDKKMHAFQRY